MADYKTNGGKGNQSERNEMVVEGQSLRLALSLSKRIQSRRHERVAFIVASRKNMFMKCSVLVLDTCAGCLMQEWNKVGRHWCASFVTFSTRFRFSYSTTIATSSIQPHFDSRNILTFVHRVSCDRTTSMTLPRCHSESSKATKGTTISLPVALNTSK